MEKPRYKHFKCEGCVFLGSTECGGTSFDMYLCDSEVVLRWGDQPEEPGHYSDNYVGVGDPENLDPVAAEIAWWPAYLEARRRCQAFRGCLVRI
jgi:hypothetical protein